MDNRGKQMNKADFLPATENRKNNSSFQDSKEKVNTILDESSKHEHFNDAVSDMVDGFNFKELMILI